MVLEFCTHPTKNPVTCRQQHQMEVQAMTQAGVMPEVLEAQLVRGRAHVNPCPCQHGAP